MHLNQEGARAHVWQKAYWRTRPSLYLWLISERLTQDPSLGLFNDARLI